MEELSPSPFGALLRRFRLDASLTQAELAERAGISTDAVSTLERGARRSPHRDTVRLLADALQLAPPDRRIFEQAAQKAALPAAVGSHAPALRPTGNFLGALPVGPLVAREEELDRIQAILDAAADGVGQLLVLGGELGVGKTRLAQEAMAEANNRGFVVGTGRCYQVEAETPYYPILEAVAGLEASAPAALRADLERRRQEIQRLVGAGRATTPGPNGSLVERQRLFAAVAGYLAELARMLPVALLLDDLHWADGGTVKLLQHLAHATRGSRTLLLATMRDARLGEEHPLLRQALQDLTRERLVERITVRRLSAEETAALVAASMGSTSEEFAEFIHRRTKGYPRFVDQMVRSLGGRLHLVREIGAGAMGRVFEAEDSQTGRPVAAKLMLARGGIDADALVRFQQEISVLAALTHPNIVEIYDAFVEEHASCIIMELLDGQSLSEILRAGPLSLSRAKAILLQVAAALEYAHAQLIVHRDIKPDNVMVLGQDRVKVTDFGIARILQPDTSLQTMATTGMRMGTPLYMAPEQIEGKKIDGRTDIYALGAMLYHMVTGRPPFEAADALTIAFKHINEAPSAPSKVRRDIPTDWDALILKALAKDPADRFQSAAQMEADIAGLSSDRAGEQGGEELSATMALRRGWAGLRLRLAANPLSLGGGVVIALIVVLIFAVVRPFQSSVGASGNLRPVTVWSAQAPGRFENPVGVAVDPQGNTYVTDQLANRIQKLSPAGRPLAQYGRSGSGPGELSGPAGVAVDSQGNIYVADTGNSRIQKLSPTGQPLKQWGQTGSGPGQFSSPFGVALDRQGNLYVADAGNARIQVLSPSGKPLHQWGSGLLQYPVGVAVDRKGNVYVSDGQSDRIAMLSSSGRLLRRWGRQGSGAGAFGDPIGLAVDRKGNVYVADQTDDTIQKFSSTGRFEGIWGTKGSAPGRFQSPQALVVDSRGHIVVADSANHRVQQLSATGKPIATWTRTGTGLHFNQPTGIAVDGDGNVYVADGAVDGLLSKLTSWGVPAPGWLTRSGSSGYQYGGVAVGTGGTVYVADQLNNAVLVLSSAGRRLTTRSGPASKPFGAPQGLAFGQGLLYVADTSNDRIVKLSATGSTLEELGAPGAAEGEFGAPAGVAVDSSGNVYVVDNRNNDVQKISAKGEFVAEWGGSGSGNGQLSSPSAVAVDAHGHVYVADTGNNRVEEFSSDGGFIRVWGAKGSLPGQFRSPGGIAVDSQGNVYVADTGNKRIQMFAPPG